MSSTGRSILPLAFGLILGLLLGAGGAFFAFLRWSQPAPPPVIGVVPAQAKPGDIVTLKGTVFDPNLQGNLVLFGERTGKVVFAGPTELRAEVPEGVEGRIGVRVLVGPKVFGPVELAISSAVSVAATVEPEALAPPSPAPSPSPELTPRASSSPQKAPPPRTPGPPPATPTPAPGAPQVAGLVRQAGSARDSRQYDAAVRLYDKALLLDPHNAEALAGRADALAGTSLSKSFMADATDVGSVKGAPVALPGFDSGDVDVKRAPEIFGWIDFEVSPQRVKPGDAYTVKIYLVNNGKKTIKIKDFSVATLVNGASTAAARASRAKEVSPRERALIDSIPETWHDGVASWVMEVRLTSARGDTYHNKVAWR